MVNPTEPLVSCYTEPPDNLEEKEGSNGSLHIIANHRHQYTIFL